MSAVTGSTKTHTTTKVVGEQAGSALMEKSVAAMAAAPAPTENGKSAPMEKSVAVVGTGAAAAVPAENGKSGVAPESRESPEDADDGPEEVDVGLDAPRTTETSEVCVVIVLLNQCGA